MTRKDGTNLLSVDRHEVVFVIRRLCRMFVGRDNVFSPSFCDPDVSVVTALPLCSVAPVLNCSEGVPKTLLGRKHSVLCLRGSGLRRPDGMTEEDREESALF